MAKVTVDVSTCVGCGLCEQVCPEVFKVEGDGVAHVINALFSGPTLQEAAQQCPVTAIKVS